MLRFMVLLVVLLLAGCGSGPSAAVPTTVPVAPTVVPSPAVPATATPISDPTAAAMARLAQQDLASRLGVAADTVAVTGVTPTEWPDSGLGCAVPGEMSLQVITPGYRLLLSSGGKAYTYHTDSSRSVVLCESGAVQ